MRTLFEDVSSFRETKRNEAIRTAGITYDHLDDEWDPKTAQLIQRLIQRKKVTPFIGPGVTYLPRASEIAKNLGEEI